MRRDVRIPIHKGKGRGGRRVGSTIPHQFAFASEEPHVSCSGNGHISEHMSGIPNWMTSGRCKTGQEITGNEE